ncbi:MAG: recombinase family protein [Mycobacterium sp.]
MSSHYQRDDLDRQVARLSEWATRAGAAVVRVETEVESGMNGARRNVRRLLADPLVATVVVEHRDRLGRMNTELVEAALSAHGRPLVRNVTTTSRIEAKDRRHVLPRLWYTCHPYAAGGTTEVAAVDVEELQAGSVRDAFPWIAAARGRLVGRSVHELRGVRAHLGQTRDNGARSSTISSATTRGSR